MFGIKTTRKISLTAWSLSAQRHLLQALEVYTGKPVRLDHLDIQTLKEVDLNNRMLREVKMTGSGLIDKGPGKTQHDCEAHMVLENRPYGVCYYEWVVDRRATLTIAIPRWKIGEFQREASNSYDVNFSYHSDLKEMPAVSIRWISGLNAFHVNDGSIVYVGRSLEDRREEAR